MPATITVLQPGDAKENPFTIVIVANPALEAPWNSGAFVPDPILADHAGFDNAAGYVLDALFGRLAGQRETFLADPTLQPHIRVVSVFDVSPDPVAANSLAAQDGVSDLLIARRSVVNAFLALYSLAADVVYAVSGSGTHTRASAWYTTDDDAGPGVPFTLDGSALVHRNFALVPGTVALPVTSASLTALHEFGHALSSYTNGSVTDLYVDSPSALNNKKRMPAVPVPANFALYNGVVLVSDPTRDGLGYPATWQSYHGALNNPAVPAVMDDYWQAPTAHPSSAVEDCEHDQITRLFLRDRLLAKLAR